MPVVTLRLAPWLGLWLAPQQRCVRPAGVSAGASNRQTARCSGTLHRSLGRRSRLAQSEPAGPKTRGPRRQQNMPAAARARPTCAAVEPPRSLAYPASPQPAAIGNLGVHRHGGPPQRSHSGGPPTTAPTPLSGACFTAPTTRAFASAGKTGGRNGCGHDHGKHDDRRHTETPLAWHNEHHATLSGSW